MSRDERGQVSMIIVGLAVVLMMVTAVAVDASAAFLQRQRLDSIAEGAALVGADAAVEGDQVYEGGLGDDRLDLSVESARAAVDAYLTDTGAYARHPGLSREVTAVDDGAAIAVVVTAPLELPLTFPGSGTSARISARGAASVITEQALAGTRASLKSVRASADSGAVETS